MMVIDKLCYHSRLRYENAGEKFAFAMITLLICVISRSIAVASIILLVMGILTVYKGGIPLLRYLQFLTVPFTFLLLSTLAVMLHISNTPMDLFAIQFGKWYLTTSYYSFFYGLQLILTASASVSCLYFLSFTTPMPDILEVLRFLHCPKLFIELMLLTYRFIFVLLKTASAIATSQSCRLGNRNYKTAMKSFGMLGSALMLRTVIRSGKLFQSMEARCYDGTIHVLSQTKPPKKKVVVEIILFDTALLLFALWRKFGL